MSISPPVGALNRYLAQLMSGSSTAAKNVGKSVLKWRRRCSSWPSGSRARQGHGRAGTLFEKFGFNYVGPIDGHDLDSLIPTLENMRHLKGPQFLHVVTKKGQGYKLAEADPWPTTAPASSTPPWAWCKPGHRPKPRSPRSSASGCATWPRAGHAPGRHHAGHARRLGHGRVREALPRSAITTSASPSSMRSPLPRAWPARAEAGGGDLFHLPAARLRPADPRCGDPEPAGGVCAGPRRPGRCRRRHPRRGLRHCLPALHSQHGAGLPGR
jgi:hypothetical protein